jgi:ATP-dependent DNA ligase
MAKFVTFERGVTSFAKLQPRMQVELPSADLRRSVPVWFYAFDLLYFASYDTRLVPLGYRKELLQKALDFNDPLRLTEYRETEGETYYQKGLRQTMGRRHRKGWRQRVRLTAVARLAQVQMR